MLSKLLENCPQLKYTTISDIYVTYVELHALREESSQTNVILQYKLLALIGSAVCSVIQQS